MKHQSFLFSIIVYLTFLIVDFSCKRDQFISSPSIPSSTPEDSLKKAFIKLQGEMDSILHDITFSKDLSNDGVEFGKLKESVFALVNYSPDSDAFNFGTACVVDTSGIALSNYHVISEYPNYFCIKPGDSIQIEVKILEENKDLDYVILQLDPRYRPYSALTKAATLPNEGADVYAIGHPKGLSFTLTKGIVSAYRDNNTYIQIDAAINSGNSGGPLLNNKGELIGINSFKYYGGENLNFALNIDYIPYKKLISYYQINDTVIGTETNNETDSTFSISEGQGNNLCIDKALRAYSEAIIEYKTTMLINMCSNNLTRFNEKTNVNTAEIQSMIDEKKSTAHDYQLFDSELEWDKVKYEIKNQYLLGTLDAILSFKNKLNKITNTHIQMHVELTDKCQVIQAYFTTINTF